MSKLSQLSGRIGDLVGRRVELRFRVAGGVKCDTQGSLALDAVNEIVTLSEQIGQLQIALADEQGRVEKELRAWRGPSPDLQMASGG
jgi:hypothetical protein